MSGGQAPDAAQQPVVDEDLHLARPASLAGDIEGGIGAGFVELHLDGPAGGARGEDQSVGMEFARVVQARFAS